MVQVRGFRFRAVKLTCANDSAAAAAACDTERPQVRGEVGESEKALASVFEMARRCFPCVLLFDEFQAMQVFNGCFLLSQLLLNGTVASLNSVRDYEIESTKSARGFGKCPPAYSFNPQAIAA